MAEASWKTTFFVQKKACRSCIYKLNSPLDLAKLEAEIADPQQTGFFKGYRICHATDGEQRICCAGFFARHSEDFQAGQVAKRLGLVKYVTVDHFRSPQEKETP